MPPICSEKSKNTRNIALFFNEKYQDLNIDRTTIKLEKVMQIWTSQATAAGLPLSNSILQLKGIEFAKLLNIEDQLKCTNERLRLRTLLAKYDEKDIYNAAFFFRMEPNQTLSTGKISRRKKPGRDQIFLLNGFIISIICENNSDLSDDDHNTEGEVAESSHSAQNQKKSKKKPIKKKPDIKLTNIELVYLPPNTTAHLQPMDAGIIHSFKSRY
uniref:DDE-1 domain-containing protein n=1 Tax=Rhizophagus irregularis (strain DAOM 181602 / DAOM 197198 / MUCL 43194) TaxID=747089 RepID=U9UN15_RHIID